MSSYSEVKRVYDVCQYMFSGEESMCWIYIIYSLIRRILNEDRTRPDMDKEEKQIDSLKGLREQGSREL